MISLRVFISWVSLETLYSTKNYLESFACEHRNLGGWGIWILLPTLEYLYFSLYYFITFRSNYINQKKIHVAPHNIWIKSYLSILHSGICYFLVSHAESPSLVVLKFCTIHIWHVNIIVVMRKTVVTGTVIYSVHVFLLFSLISYFFVNCLELFLFLTGTLGISLVDALIKK